MRPLATVLALVVLLPTVAVAEELATVEVPSPTGGPPGSYVARATLQTPDGPKFGYQPAYDCGRQGGASLAGFDPQPSLQPSIEGYTPTCVSAFAPLASAGGAYASYNVTSGHYVLWVAFPDVGFRPVTSVYGQGPAAYDDDCKDCPPVLS